MQKLISYMPECFGGGGSILGMITGGKIAEVLLFAALGAMMGLLVKELYEFCKRRFDKCHCKKLKK